MHGTTRTRPTAPEARAGVSAVVWIEPGRALMVRGSATGETSTLETVIPTLPTETIPALAALAHDIGEVDRVLVLGAAELRTALEREIVAIGHRPETILEAVVEGPVDAGVLLAKLARLA